MQHGAVSDHGGGGPRNHPGQHSPEEARARQLDPGVARDRVFSLDLQAKVDPFMRDLEALDPADVDPAHLHGIALPDPSGVGEVGGHDVPAAEHGGVREGKEQGHGEAHAQDHEETHP